MEESRSSQKRTADSQDFDLQDTLGFPLSFVSVLIFGCFPAPQNSDSHIKEVSVNKLLLYRCLCSLSQVEFPEHQLRFSNATTTLSSRSCTVRVFHRPVLAAALRARIPRNNFANQHRNNFRQKYADSHFQNQF